MLIEATRRQRGDEPFGGIVYAHQLQISIGQCIEELALLIGACATEESANAVVFLPL